MLENINKSVYSKDDDRFCGICCKQVQSSDCEQLKETLLEVFQVVIIQFNFTNTKPLICKDCKKKLLDAFERKSKWIYTEDRLFPYINSAVDGKVDVKTVYLSQSDGKQTNVNSEIQICRLCLGIINDNSWNLLVDMLEKRYSLEFFEKYVPDLNLNATENPNICKRCSDSLSVFMDFIAFCAGQEPKTEEYVEEMKTEEYMEEMKMEEYIEEIKSEECLAEVEEETKPCGTHPVLVVELERNKEEYNSSKGQLEVSKCTKCPRTSKDKIHLFKHVLTYNAEKQAKLFRCEMCWYRSYYKCNVENHFLTHKTKSLKCCKFQTNKFSFKKHEIQYRNDLIPKQSLEIKAFTCTFCSYQSKSKAHIRLHNLTHKPLSQVEAFKCGICSFATKYRTSLLRHILIHKPHSEVFKCKFCTFKTKDKRSLQGHNRTHKSPSEVEIFKCAFCSYETRYKQNVAKHVLTHDTVSKVDIMKCEICSFKTRCKRSLQEHILIHSHNPLSQVESFKCEFCSYKTTLKTNLQRHNLTHKTLSEVEVFKCALCSYQTKYKKNLISHILIHKPISQVDIFKCKVCSFKTKHNQSLRRHFLTHKTLRSGRL